MEIRFLPLQDWVILANFGRGGKEGESLGIGRFKEIRSNCFLLKMIYIYMYVCITEILFWKNETSNCELIQENILIFHNRNIDIYSFKK